MERKAVLSKSIYETVTKEGQKYRPVNQNGKPFRRIVVLPKANKDGLMKRMLEGVCHDELTEMIHSDQTCERPLDADEFCTEDVVSKALAFVNGEVRFQPSLQSQLAGFRPCSIAK